MDVLAILSRLVDPERDGIDKPFRIDVDGVAWTVATDGSGLLAFRGAVTETALSPLGFPAPSLVVDYIRAALKADKETSLHGLREFAGAIEYPSETECRDCGGTGSLCSCQECACDNCEGEGKITKRPATREVSLLGRHCDANRLAKLIAELPGEHCRMSVGGKYDPIRFRGDEWAAVLMPMVASIAKSKVRTFALAVSA